MESLESRILNWLFHGRVGMSSKAMAAVFAGMQEKYSPSYTIPFDPSDFNRCLMLLEVVPEGREMMGEVAKINPEWKLIVNRWDEIERCFIDEAGLDWSKSDSAPKTAKLMREVVGRD